MSEDRVSRAAFFKFLFGPVVKGYVCISTLRRDTHKMQESLFHWPSEVGELLDHIEEVEDSNDVYFCPQLLMQKDFKRDVDGKGPRVKENVGMCTAAWADLDSCSPDKLLVKPSLTVESSPGRYQALWVFEDPREPLEAEDISRRIAYHHISDGADKSGWDLTQLLRVPGTHNHKYEDSPLVDVKMNLGKYRDTEFSSYPTVSKRTGGGIPMPEDAEIPEFKDANNILEFLQKHRRQLNSKVFRLFSDTPEEGTWSEVLWELMMLLFEGGLRREEVFAIAQQSACNKFERDGRSDKHLWDDVCRAYIKHMEDMKAVVVPEMEHVDLIDKEELERVRNHYTFVERYIAWASSLGDAAPQYHQAGAFVILSALIAGRVALPTSYGTVVPNLWFMILADTTLTRKSTAMDIATDLLVDVDSDAIMATDGSLEGLLQGLSMRPGRPSIFLRDEFAGLLESMTKKDYMAGMAEMLTKMYDGKFQKRVLRRETIEIKEPILILFAGGIRNRIQQLLTLDHVSSGFMPRFVYLTAESDASKVRPLGPPIKRDMSGREDLLSEMRHIFGHYSQTVDVTIQGTGVHLAPPRKWQAELSPQAWARLNKFEAALVDAGVRSERPDILTPVYSRLTVSTLKAAILLAASDTRSDDVVIEEIHILHAISFAVRWREFALDVINGVGKTQSERDIERVYGSIQRSPGVSRSQLMQSYHLTARTADSIFQTLEQRGMITGTRIGRGTAYNPVRSDSE